MLRVLGVDPGISGAAVLYTPQTGEIEARRDFEGVPDVARAVAELGRRATFAVLECVGARPGQGVSSMFGFGLATGVPIGVCYTLDLPWFDIVPQSWQRWVREYVGLAKNDVFYSCHAALQCAPERHHKLFRRAKDHNTADAFLLALYGVAHAAERPHCSGRHGAQARLPELEDMLIAQMAREKKSPGG